MAIEIVDLPIKHADFPIVTLVCQRVTTMNPPFFKTFKDYQTPIAGRA